MKIRSYTELMLLPTFKERFEYLRIREGAERFAFGSDRWINLRFSSEMNGILGLMATHLANTRSYII